MRCLMLTMMWLMAAVSIQAQTFSEWFRQHKTQIKYLGQQIAVLKILSEDWETGNGIVRQGTGAIGNLLSGDQVQHADYFTGLWKVKPVVVQDARIGIIRKWVQEVFGVCAACRKLSDQGSWLLSDEQVFVSQRLDDWVGRARTIGSVLDEVVAGGYLGLSDEERLLRINDVYGTVKGILIASIRFRDQVESVIVWRQSEMRDGNDLNFWYGVKSDS